MNRKLVLLAALVILAGTLRFAFKVQRVEASGTIYIRADGSVDPITANITSLDNVTYTFTGNINDSIVVERDNIVVDGAGCTLQGTGNGTGMDLSDRSNVTIKNVEIKAFTLGICLSGSSSNTIFGSNITANNWYGIILGESSNNAISGNNITNNGYGIRLSGFSNYNAISGNDITANNDYGIYLWSSSSNQLYHNNLIDNTPQVYIRVSGYGNFWNNTVEGNYWSDYDGTDSDGDGIGDTPYQMDADNIDNHPLMGMFSSFNTSLGKRVNVISNSTIDDFEYFESNSTIRMYVSNVTANQAFGFCRVCIPHALMDVSNISVIIDHEAVEVLYFNDTIYDNDTHRWIYFAYQHSMHEVVIQGGLDTTPPTIYILSPENKTYPVNDVPLTFTVDEPTDWIGYSLDGQTNVTITGNTTLSDLFDGLHYVVVYANDTAGNMGSSDTVYFTVDTTSPTMLIVSPQNITYTSTLVPLIFAVHEPTSWIGYSLDDATNVTITGNTSLTGLLDGAHYVVVYANDTVGNMGSSDTVHFTVDTVFPNIDILSPENKTYTTSSVSLDFAVDEATSWIGYSLDGQTNVTITGNTTLSGLAEGVHTIVVYANDTVGNMGSSDTVHFTVDTVRPNIEIVSPENKTYPVDNVPLTFTVDEATFWIGYSLDGQANVTITENTTLTGLLDGAHHVVVYANDTAGNMGTPSTVYFTVDTTPPNIMILSPENKTYTTTSIPLTFTVDECTHWIAYSLDGESNTTITGNTTLSGLSDGVHTIIVYANDTVGNMGYSDTVYFTIDTVSPNIGIMSPENKTYATTDIPLTFTIDESVSWMGYSLDGRANVTISGNNTITGLSEGSHNLIVYANDTSGNMASSQKVYFTIDTIPPDIEILSPKNETYATDYVPLSFTVSEPTSWIGYSLDGQVNVTITGNTTLTGLLDGVHYVVVYANDTAGNMGTSSTVYFTVDTTPPNITDVSQNPHKDNVLPTDEVKVNATVTDELGEVEQVTLIYAYANSSGAWVRVVDMTNLEGNVWNAAIPAYPYCTNVTYAIMAEDNAGSRITTEEIGYEYQYHVIPEFSSFLILPLFMIATLLTVIVYRRKHST